MANTALLTHEHALHEHREKVKEKEKRLSLVERGEKRVRGLLETGTAFTGAVLGGVMQGMSKNEHGPKIGPVPAELVVGGGFVALGVAGIAGKASNYITEFGKGIAMAWGVDFGHAVGQRKRVTGSFFQKHAPAGTLASGSPSPQAMADALIAQAGGR